MCQVQVSDSSFQYSSLQMFPRSNVLRSFVQKFIIGFKGDKSTKGCIYQGVLLSQKIVENRLEAAQEELHGNHHHNQSHQAHQDLVAGLTEYAYDL